MAKINVPPTRSNLIRMKQELRFAREGYEILNRKREVLTSELMRVAHEAEELQTKVWERLAHAYRTMEEAQLRGGREHV
jgi:V/A-type H+-transporting ATPase subunit D